MYNKITLMGRIVHDLEIKTTPNGNTYCAFRIAVERRFKSADGERQTDFFNCKAWGKTAEMVVNWFSKGRMILVDGEMMTNQFTDKNGNNSTWYEVNVDRVSFTGEKKDDSAPAAPAQSSGTPQAGQPPQGKDVYPF